MTGALYERYSGQIYGFCLHRLGSREEAEDAVQTTFLNAFRGIARGIEPKAESAWLFKIAENVCLSRHRSSFRRRRVESPSDLEALQDVLPGHEPEKDELHGLERVLERMPETQRRAILLREWQGLSYREIADEMGITQAAVETLIFRARRSLAQGLETVGRESLPRRVRRSIDTGGLIAALKTLVGSAGAMKTAATVVAVTSATVVAATPSPTRHRHHPHTVVSPAKVHVATRPSAPARVAPVGVASRSPAPVQVLLTPHAIHWPIAARRPVPPRAPAPRHVAPVPAAPAPAPPATPTPTATPPAQPVATPAPVSPTPAPPSSQPASAGGIVAVDVSNHGSRHRGRQEAPAPQPVGGSGQASSPLPTVGRPGDQDKERVRGRSPSLKKGEKKTRQRTGAVAQTPPVAPPTAPADAPPTTDPSLPTGSAPATTDPATSQTGTTTPATTSTGGDSGTISKVRMRIVRADAT